MLLRLVSITYWTVIVLTCPIFFVGAVLIFAVTFPFDRRRVALHLYSCAWASFYVALNPFWHLRISGREHLRWRGGAVIVANHASLIDILVLFGLYRPYKWVSKDSVFKVPFVGWNMTLNDYVPIVRGDRASVLRMLDHCAGHLRKGSPVMFFPEGTRTADGLLRPFKDGAFVLAAEHGVPIVPIAVHGTGLALPKHGLVLRQQVNATVEVLEPLDPADFADPAALRDATRLRISDALRAIEAAQA